MTDVTTTEGKGAAPREGLRERKKRQTRDVIAQAAADLFAAHGFEGVTMDDVAAAAEVSRQTVFNHFASKEELLFDREAEIRAALVAAVRTRPPGRPLVEVFRAHTRAAWERFGSLGAAGPMPHDFWGIIRSSPGLREHAEVVFARRADAVAGVLAAERGLPGDDPACHALARVLCGVDTAILTCGLQRLWESAPGEAPAMATAMIAEADAAYDRLRDGLGDL